MIYNSSTLSETLCKIYAPAIESSFELLFDQKSDNLLDVYVGDSDSRIRHFGIETTSDDGSQELHEYETS